MFTLGQFGYTFHVTGSTLDLYFYRNNLSRYPFLNPSSELPTKAQYLTSTWCGICSVKETLSMNFLVVDEEPISQKTLSNLLPEYENVNVADNGVQGAPHLSAPSILTPYRISSVSILKY